MSASDEPRTHPIRGRILETFAELPGGRLRPADFAVETGEPLSHVAYHFRVLAQHGELEVVESDNDVGPADRGYRLTGQG